MTRVFQTFGTFSTSNQNPNQNLYFTSPHRHSLNPRYMDIIRTDFLALAKTVNFRDRMSTCKTINTDVFRCTKGLIPDIIRPTDLNSTTGVALVNTLYFKSIWADHCVMFTNGRRFRTGTGKALFTKFLIRKTRLLYCYDPHLRTQAVQLDYVNPHLALVLLLPDDEYLPVTSFVADYLTQPHLDRILNNLHQEHVDLVLPEFKMEMTHSSLVHPLKLLGIRELFDPERADLHRMLGSSIYGAQTAMDKVIQKVVIEVSDKSTEAASASALASNEWDRSSTPEPQYQEFHADRPFMFALVTTEELKREVLFIGVVMDPTIRR